MRTVFVNPAIMPYRKIMRNFDCATESKGNYLYQPYDFLLMSGKVPRDWPLQLVDGIADRLSEATVLAQIVAITPEIVVLAMAATNWNQDFHFLQSLRKVLPESFIFVCGDVFYDSPAREKVKSTCDGVFFSPVMFDFNVLSGQDRYSFISAHHRGFFEYKESGPLKQPVPYELKLPRHELFLSRRYRWPFTKFKSYTTIFTAWGCPYACSYCILNSFPNYWRTADSIIEELRHIKTLGIREIYIGDRSFGLPKENVKSLLNRMINEDFNFSWSSYFHPNQYTPELLELMKQSGCHTIVTGVESENIADLSKYHRHVKKSNLELMIAHAHQLGINVCGDFIIGLPHESEADIQKSIEYALKLNLDYASFNIAAPLAGSEIRRAAVESGALEENEQGYDSLGKNKVVSIGKVSPTELVNLRDRAVRSFYLRPSYLFSRLKKTSSIEHLVIQAQEAIAMLIK